MNNSEKYSNLIDEVLHCRRCENVDHSMCLLGPLNGPLDTDIMFIGTAPGKKNDSFQNKPFAGGPSARNFNSYMSAAKINRDKVHITNAVLHIPINQKDGSARNPSTTEIYNCNQFLRTQIVIVNPLIVVSLGGTVLRALSYIEFHELSLSNNRGNGEKWFNRHLFVLSHPSPLSPVKQIQQYDDYRALRKYYLKIKELKNGN